MAIIDTPSPLTGPVLAIALWDRQLVPSDIWPYTDRIGFYRSTRDESWEPWRRIEHCWYLMERFRMSINGMSTRSLTDSTMRWWVGEGGITGVVVETFDELPTAICQAALKSLHWRIYA